MLLLLIGEIDVTRSGEWSIGGDHGGECQTRVLPLACLPASRSARLACCKAGGATVCACGIYCDAAGRSAGQALLYVMGNNGHAINLRDPYLSLPHVLPHRSSWMSAAVGLIFE